MEVFEKYLLKIKNEAHRSRMREVLAWVKDTFPTLTPSFCASFNMVLIFA